MEYWFTTVCFLSLAGSGAMLAVWAVCRLGNGRLSCRWRYYIWLLPLILLLLPITPFRASSVSAASPVPAQVQAETGGEIIGRDPVQLPAMREEDTETVFVLPSDKEERTPEPDPAAPIQASSAPDVPLPELLSWIWLAGVLCLSVWNGVRAVRLRRLLGRVSGPAEPWEEELLEKQAAAAGVRRPITLRRYAGTGTPFLYGLLRPAVYLPETALTPFELAQVLTHELIHCRRRDLLVKKLAWLARTAHWFNPLTWLLERQVDHRCELACDEAVTAGLDWEERRAYGLTLIKLMRGRDRLLPASACLAERGVKERLEVLMKPLKEKKGRRVSAMLMAVILCLGSTALAAEINGMNPSGSYQADQVTDLYYVDWLCSDLSGDRGSKENYGPGSGYSRYAAGTATLMDTPLQKSFSAQFTADRLWSFDRNATAADCLPESTFRVEMTQLDRVIKSRGEWVGRFTVLQDGVPIFTDEPGKLTHVPSLDGTQLTALTVGPDGIHYFYARFNFGLSGTEPMDGEAAAQAETRALEEHPDTVEIRTRQSAEAQIDGYTGVPFYVNNFYVNDTLGQMTCSIMLDAQEVGYSGRYDMAEHATIKLELRPQDVTFYDADRAAGLFFLGLPNGQDREFTGTLSGLNGAVGDVISLRADDGSLAVAFTIERGRKETVETAPASDQDLHGLSEEEIAYYRFSDTCEICESTRYIGTNELPFAITAEGNNVTVCYTGDTKYRTGVQLRSSSFGDWYGLNVSVESRLLGSAGASIQLPKDAVCLELVLYQASSADGADFIRYNLTLYRGRDGVLATQCQRYRLFNSGYTGAQAEAMLNYHNQLVPEFMQ